MKPVIRLLSVFVFAALVAGCAREPRQPAMNIARITFDTLPYPGPPQLLINYENDDLSEECLTIENSSSEAGVWSFSYPDSLYPRIASMQMRVPSGIDSLIYDIGLMKAGENYAYLNDKFLLSRRNTDVSLKYLSTDTSDVQHKRFVHSYYTVENTDDKELWSSMGVIHNIGLTFSHIPGAADKWASVAAKYPDSRFFIAHLANQMLFFSTREDVATIFGKFSEENKAGFFGSRISRYLTADKFENMELPAWDTGELEPIINDFSKPSLVIFSASWCVHCHRIIPLYKEIYKDLSEKLNMVYVSVDEPMFRDSWSKIMTDNEILWRSVIALDKRAYVENKYSFTAIPHQLLVYPDGKMEKIDVRKEDGLAKLYSATAH